MSTFQYACIYFYKHIPNIYYYYITIPLKTKRHMGTENDNVSIAAAQKKWYDIITKARHFKTNNIDDNDNNSEKIQQTTQKHRRKSTWF